MLFVFSSLFPRRMNTKEEKLKANRSPCMDDLPSDVIDAILVRLPIKDAVRTSILSRRWMYRWTAMTQLKFVEDINDQEPEVMNVDVQEPEAIDDVNQEHAVVKDEVHQKPKFSSLIPCGESFNIVDPVLMLHDGPIHRFKVSAAQVTNPSKIDQWIIVLKKKNIKELVLDLHGNKLYTVHSSLFSCQGITALELSCCIINLPPGFKGFVNLLSLHLQNSQLSQGGLQSLISKTPLLKSLTLINVKGCDCFEINNPCLEELYFKGQFTDFSLVTSPVLARLHVELEQPIKLHHSTRGIGNISKILACANSIEKLELALYSPAFLAVGSKQEKLPVVFPCLRILVLDINFLLMEENLFVLSLLRSSPCLQQLTFWGYTYREDQIVGKNIWKTDNHVDDFNHLRIVKFIGIECIEPEMEFIRFLLGHAPMLEKMEIVIYARPGISRDQVFMDLLRFQRASRKVEIICTS